MAARLNSSDPDFRESFKEQLGKKREVSEDVDVAAAAILRQVRETGDDAVIELTAKFDRLELESEQLRISTKEIADARSKCAVSTLDALQTAADRIERFHEKQLPGDISYSDELGVKLGMRWQPISAVGLYVPGGTAAYPSSVLMNALPAKVAGVSRIAMVVPSPDGILNPLVLAAADLAGIDEIYRIGGAQAIGALAYGTETIAPVDKIVGPGNAYVAAAKRRVFGTVGIDMIAGPSEILVVADADNDPSWIAADLLSQAEHDTASQSILITDNQDFANNVEGAVERWLQQLDRTEIAASSWRDHGLIICVDSLVEAPQLIDQIAPEHLELAVEDPAALARKVHHAGAIFMGRYTPEAIGDYVAGPNHVLPTARSARFASGLSVLDFMKRSTLVECDEANLAQIGPAAVSLAEAEGLGAHALSVAVRLPGSRH